MLPGDPALEGRNGDLAVKNRLLQVVDFLGLPLEFGFPWISISIEDMNLDEYIMIFRGLKHVETTNNR